MKRRHPHIFGTATVKDADDVLMNWEEIKYQEKKHQRRSALDGIPRHLPSLLKAHRIQDKASRLGFDWDHVDEVMAKLNEEMEEFSRAFSSGKRSHMQEELGDILFSLVNLARFMGINPEDALRDTINKFIGRFQHIERSLQEKGQSFRQTSLEEMEKLWQQAKNKPQAKKGARRQKRS